MRRSLTLGLVAVATLVTLRAQNPHVPDFSKVENIIRNELTTSNAPGATVAVVINDRIVFRQGYGVANVETSEPVRPEMLFRLGSTTKMITAATVVALAEQGTLDLTAPISRYIPGLAPAVGRLTADQLLSHMSGLFDEAPMFGSHDDGALTAEVMRWTNERFFAEAGEIYSYSNPGYWLAGLLAETVGGRPFADQVAESIFAPLGMTRSTFRPTLAMTYPLAQGHDLVQGKLQVIRPSANNAASWPAGSIFSNVNDLSRWMIAFVNTGLLDGRQVLPASLFTTLKTPRASIPGSRSKYGYGVQVSDYRGLELVEHAGSRSGYGSTIRMVPSRKVGVVVLANRTGVSMSRSAAALLNEALGPLPFSDTVLGKPELTESQLRAFEGTYTQGPRRMTMAVVGGRLTLKQGQSETALEPLSEPGLADGTALFVAGATRYVFVKEASGAVRFLHSGGRSWRKIQ